MQEILRTDSLELHPLSSLHPLMSAEMYAAFKEDIKDNGQLVPVTTYRGKIVDGRHRLKALQELGIDMIKAEALPNNFKIEDVERVIQSTEKRRHQTTTQLAIKAYRLYRKEKCTQEQACKKIGCSRSNLNHVVAIQKLAGDGLLELLEQGGKINISEDSRYTKMSDSLLAIKRKLVKEDEQRKLLAEPGIVCTEQEEFILTKEEYAQVRLLGNATKDWSWDMKQQLIKQLLKDNPCPK